MPADIGTGELQDGWCDVDRRDQLLDPHAGADDPWEPYQQGVAYRFLVRKATLDAQAMLAEEKAVVAGQYDCGGVQSPRLLDFGQDGTQAFIDRENHLGPVTNALL